MKRTVLTHLAEHCITSVVIGILTIHAHCVCADVPIRVGEFAQPYHRPYCADDGLPVEGVTAVAIGAEGRVFARGATGDMYRMEHEKWSRVGDDFVEETLFERLPRYDSLSSMSVSQESVRDVATHEGEIAVAAKEGLFLGDGTEWELALPQEGDVRWAPVDVRGVAYDASGKLWFAAPQGVGCRTGEGEWKLFTGQDGLPYNDFTCIAAGPESVWFGTTNGAVKYADGQWFFRQGGRWLLDNHVRDVAVDAAGDAWIATSAGVSCITTQRMTLTSKAAYLEDEIERYNRRTKFGYVNPANLSSPGDKSTATPTYSDNDGFNTGLYLAAVSFGYAVTEDPRLKEYADNAFRALLFLSEVTQGGEHGAPKGFVARNVVRTTEANPNDRYDLEYDVRRNKRDALWKIMHPRVPTDKTGQWYWKCDSSSDELDGHFLGYAVYFDLICETEEQKEPVRQVVRDIIEHLLKHDYSLVDHDGKPWCLSRHSEVFCPSSRHSNIVLAAWNSRRGHHGSQEFWHVHRYSRPSPIRPPASPTRPSNWRSRRRDPERRSQIDGLRLADQILGGCHEPVSEPVG